MADVFDKQKRSEVMSRVRGKDTKPELRIRRGLHALGLRYRLHVGDLPGSPDLVFPKFRAVIFVHGCFWHRHDCHLFSWPATHPEFWREKLGRNQARDLDVRRRLREQGWRSLVIWECALKGRTRRDLAEVLEDARRWLETGAEDEEIGGLGV